MPATGTQDFAFNEPLVFEQGSPGRTGVSAPTETIPNAADAKTFLGDFFRDDSASLPELSEPEVVRHFVRLSQQNFSIDTGMVPLGSCTMKYNPKVNEWAARLSGFADLHPYQNEDHIQGALELMFRLERALAEIVGMDHVSLQPAAGAQGELTALMMIRAYHQAKGRSPKTVLVPETAHGTNAATCALNGLAVKAFSAPEGIIHIDELEKHVTDDVAAIMITNPNTVGLFEQQLPEIAKLVHDKGALVFGDGANLNALMGKARPGDLGVDIMQFNLHKTFTTPHGGGGPGCGPVAYKQHLDDFAPIPVVKKLEDERFTLDYERAQSIGRIRSFYGNFGMMVRAYTYIREMGAKGLAEATEGAVLNANYLRSKLKDTWDLAYDRLCMHEFIASDRHLKSTGVTTLDIAKRLMDYGFHAPTVYWPLVVKGAMLIEPTETESKQSLDLFVEAMLAISDEAQNSPELVKTAPHNTRLKRLDETQAARNPVLRY
ncbi:MAG: aminomethyl-transferring glycine dehydrogenase subunit GcvPB [Myxococcales bacterium]|nr:MAG: aminomethyl-transferring glycine dehydrogenase subunit GcvPB [Myxococcales bacterium]